MTLAADNYHRIGRLEERIAELEAERRWIPVGKRLPDGPFDVLVTYSDGRIGLAARAGKAWYATDGYDHEHGPTHWMPLPKPPEATDAN